MKNVLAAVITTSIALGGALTAFAHEGAHTETKDKAVTVQGELIDTACYVASGGDAKGKEHAGCASKCLGSGVPAGILPEGSKDATAMMFLLTNPTVLANYAGQTIKVEGTSHANMHALDVNKLYVKDGSGWKEVALKDEHHNMAGGEKAKDDGHKDHEHKYQAFDLLSPPCSSRPHMWREEQGSVFSGRWCDECRVAERPTTPSLTGTPPGYSIGIYPPGVFERMVNDGTGKASD